PAPMICFGGKDGIYMTSGGEPISLTDADAYLLFPNEGNPGQIVNGIPGPSIVPFDSPFLRLNYYDEFLYFDYIQLAPLPTITGVQATGLIGTVGVFTTVNPITITPCPGYTNAVGVEINHNQLPSSQTNFVIAVDITDARLKHTSFGGFVQNINGFDIQPS